LVEVLSELPCEQEQRAHDADEAHLATCLLEEAGVAIGKDECLVSVADRARPDLGTCLLEFFLVVVDI